MCVCCVNVSFSVEIYLSGWQLNTFFTCISVQPVAQLAALPVIQPVTQPEANKDSIQDEQPASDDDEEDKIESEAENEDGDEEEELDLEGVFDEVPGKFK